jgi:hypothetical protein
VVDDARDETDVLRRRRVDDAAGELFVKRGLCCDVPGLGRLAQLVGRDAAASSISRPTAAPLTAAITGMSVCSRVPAVGVERGSDVSRAAT